MGITHDDVQRIIQLLNETRFDELHLEADGLKLDIRRTGAARQSVPADNAQTPEQPLSPASPPLRQPAAQSVPSKPSEEDADTVIRAPMLGTFYRCPKPGEPPFVDAGSKVEPDTVIGIIEVMKLMHSISAGVSGKVVDILKGDGEFVEYGQVLMRVSTVA